MRKLTSNIVAIMLLSVAACSKPDLPDPKIEYQAPPAELMKPVEKMKPL